jgi:DNA gyrase subunit A
VASTHDYILFFTNRGKVYWLKVYDIPEMQRTAKGRSLANLIQFEPGESVSQELCVRDFDDKRCVILATRQGTIKKTNLSAFSHPKKTGIIAISLGEGDALIGAEITTEGMEVILSTKQGMAIRFPESDVRAMGRTASGVGGIALREGDEVVDMVVLDPKVETLTLLTACENGFWEAYACVRVPAPKAERQRYDQHQDDGSQWRRRGTKAVTDEDDLVLMTQNGIILRTSPPICGRSGGRRRASS